MVSEWQNVGQLVKEMGVSDLTYVQKGKDTPEAGDCLESLDAVVGHIQGAWEILRECEPSSTMLHLVSRDLQTSWGICGYAFTHLQVALDGNRLECIKWVTPIMEGLRHALGVLVESLVPLAANEGGDSKGHRARVRRVRRSVQSLITNFTEGLRDWNCGCIQERKSSSVDGAVEFDQTAQGKLAFLYDIGLTVNNTLVGKVLQQCIAVGGDRAFDETTMEGSGYCRVDEATEERPLFGVLTRVKSGKEEYVFVDPQSGIAARLSNCTIKGHESKHRLPCTIFREEKVDSSSHGAGRGYQVQVFTNMTRLESADVSTVALYDVVLDALKEDDLVTLNSIVPCTKYSLRRLFPSNPLAGQTDKDPFLLISSASSSPTALSHGVLQLILHERKTEDAWQSVLNGIPLSDSQKRRSDSKYLDDCRIIRLLKDCRILSSPGAQGQLRMEAYALMDAVITMHGPAIVKQLIGMTEERFFQQELWMNHSSSRSMYQFPPMVPPLTTRPSSTTASSDLSAPLTPSATVSGLGATTTSTVYGTPTGPNEAAQNLDPKSPGKASPKQEATPLSKGLSDSKLNVGVKVDHLPEKSNSDKIPKMDPAKVTLNRERMFSVDIVLMRGYLWKRSTNRLRIIPSQQWQKRFCVLDGMELLYFDPKVERLPKGWKGATPKGSIDLRQCVDISVEKGPLLFEICTANRVYEWKAENQTTKNQWVQSILSAMKGSQPEDSAPTSPVKTPPSDEPPKIDDRRLSQRAKLVPEQPSSGNQSLVDMIASFKALSDRGSGQFDKDDVRSSAEKPRAGAESSSPRSTISTPKQEVPSPRSSSVMVSSGAVSTPKSAPDTPKSTQAVVSKSSTPKTPKTPQVESSAPAAGLDQSGYGTPKGESIPAVPLAGLEGGATESRQAATEPGHGLASNEKTAVEETPHDVENEDIFTDSEDMDDEEDEDAASVGDRKTDSAETKKAAQTPENMLQQACVDGNLEEAQTLIEEGVATSSQDEHGCSPLHHAATSGHTHIVKLLVKNKVFVNTLNCDGHSPLHLASWRGHIGVVRTLLIVQADTGLEDVYGMTALHWAAFRNHNEIVRCFVLAGCDLERANVQSGWSALHYAAVGGALESAAYLLKQGASSNVPDVNNHFPYDLALQHNHPRTAETIARNGEKGAKDNLVESAGSKNYIAFSWSQLQKVAKLRVGSTKDVYKGKWGNLEVALLVLRKSTDDRMRALFLEQLQMLADLRHENILMVYGAVLGQGRECVVTEFMNGGNLRSALVGVGPLSRKTQIRLMKMLCDGVSFLHLNGICGNNVSSKNILVDKALSKLKIMEIGCGGGMATADYNLSFRGINEIYQPPEVIQGIPAIGKSVTMYASAGDVYSMALVYHEIVTRKLPFPKTKSFFEIRNRILNGYRPIEQLEAAGLPRALFYLIHRMWSSRVEDRPGCAEIRKILESDEISRWVKEEA